MTPMTLAQRWAEAGWPAFPIAIGWDEGKGATSKRPLTPRGHSDASADPEVVRDLFVQHGDRLHEGEVLGVGVVPGPAGFVVLDCDVHGGANGPGYADSIGANGTWTVDTASKGEHRIYRKPEVSRVYGNATPESWRGLIDVRGDAGWIVAAGTSTPWGSWTARSKWSPGAVRDLPTSLDKLLRAGRSAVTVAGGGIIGSWHGYKPGRDDEHLHPATVELHDLLVASYGVNPACTLFNPPRDVDGFGWLAVTRPGKSVGQSASLGVIGPDVMKVFSSSWPPFQADGRYTLDDLRESADHAPKTPKTSGPDEGAEGGNHAPKTPKTLEPEGFGSFGTTSDPSGDPSAGGFGSFGTTSGLTEPWETPEPIGFSAEPIPLDGLPEMIRDVVTEVATQAQAPPELVLGAVLGAASAATRGAWEVRVSGAWSAGPAIVWTLALAESGERKDAATRPIFAPLREAEIELGKRLRKDIDKAKSRQKKTLAEAAEASKAGDHALAAHLQDMAEREAPREPLHLVLDDTTTEALGMHMQRQRGPVAIVSTEAQAFRSVAGAYSGGGNHSLLNKAYDAEPYYDARVTREGLALRRAVLTWSAAVQPPVMQGYANNDSEGSGFLGRFLYLVPESMVGTRLDVSAIADPFKVGAWRNALHELHAEGWRRFAMMTEDATEYGPPMVLPLDPDGQAMVHELSIELEKRKGLFGDLHGLGGWIERHPARLARVASTFTLLANPQTSFVDAEDVASALSLSESLIEHAQVAFQLMRGGNGLTEDAAVLAALSRVRRDTDGYVTTRVVYHGVRGQSWVTDADDVRAALQRLATLGWVRAVPAPRGTAGRPTERWAVHPDVLTA